MKHYNIGAVARLTGLSVHNLRVWERRHHAITTVRSEGGRRLYDESAVERLLLLKKCVDRGVGISHLASLNDGDLQSLLAELETARPTDTSPPSLCLVGHALNALLDDDSLTPLGCARITRFTSADQLGSGFDGSAVSALVLDEATVSTTESDRVLQLAQLTGAASIWVIYRYGRQRELQQLRNRGVNLLRAPVDKGELLQALSNSLRPGSPEIAEAKAHPAPPRRFSQDDLARLSRLATRIDCECPRHLSELISALGAFETYSSQCENRNEADAALHHNIYCQTAAARAMMENLLAGVLAQEGITLDPPDLATPNPGK